MTFLWLIIIIAGLSLAFFFYREWRRNREIEKDDYIRDIKRKVKEEISEKMVGKTPEEKAKYFNEKMKEYLE